jgi:hypothetical protein
MIRLGLIAISLTLTLSGCTLYIFGDDDGDDGVCLAQDEADDRAGLAALLDLVNPQTLECESFGTGGCGPCGCVEGEGDAAPIPSWGYCASPCTGLDEGTCLGATGCRAAYDYNCYTGQGPCTALQPYLGCYATDMTGPIQGDCTGLDSWQCSLHDDCIALHSEVCSGGTCYQSFVECGPEVRELPCDGGPGDCG